MQRVRLETSRVRDWDSFHDEFARLFGFPAECPPSALRCLGSLHVLDRRCFILSAFADKGVIAVAAVDDGRGYGFAEDDGVVPQTGVDDQSLYFGGSEVERRSAVAGNGEQAGGFTDFDDIVRGGAEDFEFVFAVRQSRWRVADDAGLS